MGRYRRKSHEISRDDNAALKTLREFSFLNDEYRKVLHSNLPSECKNCSKVKTCKFSSDFSTLKKQIDKINKHTIFKSSIVCQYNNPYFEEKTESDKIIAGYGAGKCSEVICVTSDMGDIYVYECTLAHKIKGYSMVLGTIQYVDNEPPIIYTTGKPYCWNYDELNNNIMYKYFIKDISSSPKYDMIAFINKHKKKIYLLRRISND